MSDGNGLMTKGLGVRLRFATGERLVASVRQGDPVAFEALYERHVSELLSFCVYMLGSRQDAEDAVQATFASAYRALRADRRKIALRPWLFTIARNESLSILRSRRPTVELNGEPALGGDPLRELEVREEVRHVVEDLRKLPENQRAALVLAEMQGLSQVEIATVMGVRADQVKAYIFQARSNLLSERRAREIDCREIREELANARGAALLRGRLRRHLRSCQDCRVYANGVARQRRQLGALLPLAPSLALKYRALGLMLESGVADPAPYAGGAAVTGSVVGAAVELAGGGVKAVALKVATGLACVCASIGVGASALSSHVAEGLTGAAPPAAVPAQLAPLAAVVSAHALGLAPGEPRLVEVLPMSGAPTGNGPQGAGEQAGPASQPVSLPSEPLTTAVTVTRGGDAGSERGATSQDQTESERERQRKHEENEKEGEEDRQEREEHKQAHEEHKGEPEEHKGEREEHREEHKGEREEHKQEREERQREREEGDQIGRSRPPKTEEELQRKREERQREREEGDQIGRSRPPKTEEERQHLREERQRKREERQQ